MADVSGVAHGVVNSLKSQPLALALVVMNFALIGFVYYQSSIFNTQREANVKLFVDVQREVQKLLSQCIIPPPSTYRGSVAPGDASPATSISQGP
jgi:membrane-anchored glycerophosphoryl diester phosphodiesterase (GDPDase)